MGSGIYLFIYFFFAGGGETRNGSNISLAISSYNEVKIPLISKLLDKPRRHTCSFNRGRFSSVYSLRKLEALFLVKANLSLKIFFLNYLF